eukprot:TRINITY_DN25453_c0_g1_i1.p1 TRINITY_DN25453_c0_g1~~TRINITY_DN25453_c0_g1_i1.p1  ORF type:complete len:545 (-),score=117.37 TRINITY_DN25453_c0_g1_i1:286-1869(-)
MNEAQGDGDVREPDTSCKVKNTFLEFSVPTTEDDIELKRRSRSDCPGGTRRNLESARHSPMVVAAKSPPISPLQQPAGAPGAEGAEPRQAVPIDEVDFELLETAVGDGASSSRPRYQSAGGLERDEPAYVVPTTPSPFLQSSFAPQSAVPTFDYMYGLQDSGLPPPAFGGAGDPTSVDGGLGFMPPMDGDYMRFFAEMYGADCAAAGMYMPYWPEGMMPEGMGDLGMVDPSAFPAMEVSAEPGAVDESKEPAAASQEATQPEKAKATESGDRKNGKSERGKDRGEGRNDEKADGREEKTREGKKESGKKSSAAQAASSGNGAWDEKSRGKSSTGGAGSPTSPTSGRQAEASGDDGRKKGAGKGEEAPERDPANCTTVMLRNIPNKYTQEMLIKQLNVDFDKEYDFIYMPIDFKNECNVGYSFINFITPGACSRFQDQYHGVDVRKCLPGLNSRKIVEVTPARVQGLHENVQRLRNSPVMSQLLQHPEWMPQIFTETGDEVPFPAPEVPLQPVKRRGRNRENKASQEG